MVAYIIVCSILTTTTTQFRTYEGFVLDNPYNTLEYNSFHVVAARQIVARCWKVAKYGQYAGKSWKKSSCNMIIQKMIFIYIFYLIYLIFT